MFKIGDQSSRQESRSQSGAHENRHDQSTPTSTNELGISILRNTNHIEVLSPHHMGALNLVREVIRFKIVCVV